MSFRAVTLSAVEIKAKNPKTQTPLCHFERREKSHKQLINKSTNQQINKSTQNVIARTQDKAI